MLLVNARKGPSKIHGQGLIAQEFIPKGTRIWEFRAGYDNTFTPEEFLALPVHAQKQALFYSYYDHRLKLYIMSGDDDRHTNHSDTPNCGLDADGDSTVALVDIQAGEELVWDYRPWGGLDHHLKEGFLLPHEQSCFIDLPPIQTDRYSAKVDRTSTNPASEPSNNKGLETTPADRR